MLRTAVFVGCVVMAFLLAFATGGFWPKASWDMEQPTVRYSGDAVAVFEVRTLLGERAGAGLRPAAAWRSRGAAATPAAA